MKLLQRTGLYFMGISFLILLFSGIGIFYALQYMLDHEMDESLHHTRAVLNKELSKMDSLGPLVEIMDEVIDIREVKVLTDLEIYQDTFRLVEELENGLIKTELEPFRQYIYTDKIRDKYYRIALNHSKFGSEHLLTAITALVIGFLLLFFLILNFFNRFLSQKLWKPFYHTINQVRKFSFSHHENLNTLPTNIEEFNTLNEALQQMMDKLTKDYHSLKSFAENASHEIQTPLAIIKSQIDLLLQKKQKEDSLKYIQQIQKSANKLSKLNKSLLLLTRIENRQFEGEESILLNEVIEQKIEAMEILFDGKNLRVEKQLSAFTLSANSILVDVMINNLLSNAIRHNVQGGYIQVILTSKGLMIKNTGQSTTKQTAELFERFRKSDDAGNSIGLGLAIVKEICNLYDWQIEYHNEGEWHTLQLTFNFLNN